MNLRLTWESPRPMRLQHATRLVDPDWMELYQGTAIVGTGMGLFAAGVGHGDQPQPPAPTSAPVQIPGPICKGLKAEAGGPPPDMPFPNYLESYADPVYGSRITRITGDKGSPLPIGEGAWQGRTRSIYSMKQVWSADEALIYLHFGGPLLLDGSARGRAGSRNPNKGNVVRWNRIDRTDEPVKDHGERTYVELPGYQEQ